jgi:glycosyl transferase family 2
MNEVLRLLDRVLKKQGYSIKKHPEYNLLPLKQPEGFAEQKKVYDAFNSNNEAKLDNTNKIEVCLRTCINDKRAKGKRSELTKVTLEEHLLKCINSLLISINEAKQNKIDVSLTIFDDRSEQSTQDKIKALCEKLKCGWQLITTNKTGQGESLHEHFSYAKDKDALFYFCEDDYLHETNAISEMAGFYKKAYEQTGLHLLIHPQEHELIYNQYSYPSYILLGENRRWRTMSNATHTFFTHSSVVENYWEYFENTKYVGIKEKRHLGSEKKTTDQLFNHIPGFSPIPAVAVHLQTEECLPPFYDWRTLWEKTSNI